MDVVGEPDEGVGVLGPVCLRVAGAEVVVAGRRERCVLAVLALHAGRIVSTDVLADHLWGDEPPRSAKKSLQTAVANLRSALRDASAGSGDGVGLETAGSGYRLAVPDSGVDALRFRDLSRRAAEAMAARDPTEAALLARRALDLWRADEPADFGDGVAATIAARELVEDRLRTVADRIDADLALGRHQAIVAELGALCEAWPLDERLCAQLMLSSYRSNRQADALAAFRRLRRALIEQLGLEPSEALRALEQRIIEQDEQLAPPTPPSTEPSGRGGPQAMRRIPLRGRLVGRDEVISAVCDLVPQRRLVTLVGPGGVGKTAVAEQVISALADQRSVWCGLAHLRRPDGVIPLLATELDLQPSAGTTMREGVISGLRSQPTVLVVDNCEHLLDAVVEIVGDLLARCEDLHVLATSRERLGVQGELFWPVEALACGPDSVSDVDHLPDAVDLFVQRAVESDPHFTLTPPAARAIGTICRHLDGMPLAIELAAARVRALPPAEIARRLDDRFSLLVGGRGLDDRQRTLRATVDWSHELLGERERRLFRRLASFAGPFTIGAAEAVASLDDLAADEIPALLADLVDRSMVVVSHDEPDWRYRLLDTLRAYAEERLEAAGETDRVETANVAYHRSLLTELGTAVTGDDEPSAVARIDGAFDNARHAVSLARRDRDADALGDLVGSLSWYLRFHVRWEASAWAQDAFDLFSEVTPSRPAAMNLVAGMAAYGHWFAGELDEAERIIELTVASEARTARWFSNVVATRSLLMMYRDDPGTVAETERAIALARSDEDDWTRSYLLGQLAIRHAYRGAPEVAAPVLDEQATVVEQLDNTSARAWWLYCRAEVTGDGDPAETIQLARAAFADASRARSNLLENVSGITALTVAARHGDPAELLDDFASLITRFRADGAWTHLQVIVWNLLEALERLGQDDACAELLGAAMAGEPTPYGEQLTRLVRVRSRLEGRMDPEDLERSERRGERLTREDVADVALETLDSMR